MNKPTNPTERIPGSALRQRYPEIVERGRCTKAGPWPSPSHAPFGRFFVPLKMRTYSVQALVIVGDDDGWDHVSVSLPGRNRCPTWEEMCEVRDLFFDPSYAVIQIHPAVEDYCNDHPYCLHLWQCQQEILPKPPVWMVGLGRKNA